MGHYLPVICYNRDIHVHVTLTASRRVGVAEIYTPVEICAPGESIIGHVMFQAVS